MQMTTSHPVYGLITCEESFWTGKNTLLFNGIPLQKINKTTFQLPVASVDPFAPAEESAEGASEPLMVTVKGSYLTGLTLTVGGEVITLSPKAKALDIVLGLIPAVLFFSFVIGGAIGGGLGAMIGMGLIIVMKTRKKTVHKVLICLGASAVVLVIGIPLFLLALSQI